MVQEDCANRTTEVRALIRSRRLDDARSKCEALCRDYPDDAESWYLLGSLAGQGGDFSRAVTCFRKATDLDPQHAGAFLNLGRALDRSQNYEEAEPVLRRTLQLRPKDPSICFLLGHALHMQDKHDEAIAMYTRAVSLDPNNLNAYYNLGWIYHNRGELAKAEEYYRLALRVKPDFLEARKRLGIVLVLRGEYNDALKNVHEALLLSNNKDGEMYYWLGRAYLGLDNFAKAKINYEHAIESGFLSVELFSEVAYLSQQNGDYGDARKYSLRAIELAPDHAGLYLKLGEIEEYLGQEQEAERNFQHAASLVQHDDNVSAALANIYHRKGANQKALGILEPLIENNNRNVNVLLVYAKTASRLGKTEKAVILLEDLLGGEGRTLSPQNLRDIHFMLGDLYDRQHMYDRAFTHFRKANSLKNARYDSSEDIEFFDRLAAVFSKEFLSWAPRATQHSEQLIFIVGMPRSGTSLVEQILASHPQVFGGGELAYIHEIVQWLPTRLGTQMAYPDCVGLLTKQVCDELALAYLQRIRKLSKGEQYVTDKMPHNFQNLGLVSLLFPQAKIVHCVRDPLDTCLSCYFTNFTVTHPYSFDLKDLGIHYREYRKLMKHWDNVLDLECMNVAYEDLVRHPKKTVESLLAFVGLPWNERCLHFYETRRAVTTASYEQVREPIYSSSIGRWKNYRPYLEELRESLMDMPR